MPSLPTFYLIKALTPLFTQIDRVHFNLVDGTLPDAPKIQKIFEAFELPPTWFQLPRGDKHENLKYNSFAIWFKDDKNCERFISLDRQEISERALYLGKLLRSAQRGEDTNQRPKKQTRITWLSLCPDLAEAVKNAEREAGIMAGRGSPTNFGD